MRSVPLDLKRRIVEAYERKEGKYFELARRFGVGEATVYRLLRLKRERGSIELTPRARAGVKRGEASRVGEPRLELPAGPVELSVGPQKDE